MRAVLILGVLLAWTLCVVGAVGLTAYLAVVAVGTERARRLGAERVPTTPPRGAVVGLVAFAAFMAACAGGLAALSLWNEPADSVRSAVVWAALPTWAAMVAAITAIVLRRRGRCPM